MLLASMQYCLPTIKSGKPAIFREAVGILCFHSLAYVNQYLKCKFAQTSPACTSGTSSPT